ncbi:hypothetical protein D3C71_79020 [compost metagenome]
MIPAVIRRLVQRIYPGKRTSSLKRELQNLRVNISRSERRLWTLAGEFENSGMSCCPDCAYPEYSNLVAKNRRRHTRILQLEAKIKRDEQRASAPSIA